MAGPRAMSIDVAGEWSPRQADAVIDGIRDEAAAIGLEFRPVDVVIGGPRRVRLVAYCLRHGGPIEPDAACRSCLRAG